MSALFSEEALRRALRARPFRFYPQTASTQDDARVWALADPPAPHGAVVIAEAQSAGRGRQGRRWQAARGTSLLFSVILRPRASAHLPQYMMVGGLAVHDVLSERIGAAVTLKWPNDVLIGGRKVCGVLAEGLWLGETLNAVILGVGINVRANFGGPQEATSVEEACDCAVDRLALLGEVLARVDAWDAQVGTETLLAAWRARLSTLGRRVIVYPRDGAPPFEGVAEAVGADGALIVRLPSGERQPVRAADVGVRADWG